MAVIRFYNTLSRKKEVFRPLRDKRVNLFVCGPTVDDRSHIGHARTYLVYDMLTKYLRSQGYKVFFLENITDVSDKIIRKSNETSKKYWQVAKEFEIAFLKSMESLGINSVTRYARASDFIPEIIGQIERLIKRGAAYKANGNVYFRTRKFKGYGKLSHQNINKVGKLYKQAMISEGEIDPSEGKEEEIDFALWKAAKPGEPRWKSPWGWGRPGWHIEDTAITETFFGPQYDIHGGGIGLIFPHHECEIAQQETATGKKPFVKYWLHAGHLKVEGTKMSQSLGNIIATPDMLKSTPPEVFRLFVAQHHYRSPVDYSKRAIGQAEKARRRLLESIDRLKSVSGGEDKLGTSRAIAKTSKAFYDALADDFNTPKALAEIFKLISRLNPLLSKGNISAKAKQETLKFLREVDTIFGIIGKTTSRQAPEEIKRLVRKRESLRKEKKWQEADRVRKQVEKLGWQIDDTPAGSRLKKAN
ncbi:MAG: cysteine--tRNA ligase [Parcubacteria group bacterium]|nr:cysteine--tRNA ligase [Parcubacteria group bacterium]